MRPEDHEERTDDRNRRRFLVAIIGTAGIRGGADVASVTGVRDADPADTDAPTPEQSGRLLAEAAGTGTQADPYVITTARGLQAIRQDLSAAYELGQDIDTSVTVDWNDGAGFQPIGDERRPFTGSLNGQGHTIRGLTIRRPEADSVGLFGVADGGDGRSADGTIRDLSVTEASVEGGVATGALVGRARDVTIDGVTIGGIGTETNATGELAGHIESARGPDGGACSHECRVGRSITGDSEGERLSGSFTAVVDRFEDDRAVLVLGRTGETAGEFVTGSEELPDDGRHVDAVLEVTLSEGVLVAVEYHPEETDGRAESAQRRFGRLSGRPPDPDDTEEQ